MHPKLPIPSRFEILENQTRRRDSNKTSGLFLFWWFIMSRTPTKPIKNGRSNWWRVFQLILLLTLNSWETTDRGPHSVKVSTTPPIEDASYILTMPPFSALKPHTVDRLVEILPRVTLSHPSWCQAVSTISHELYPLGITIHWWRVIRIYVC